MKGKGGKNFFLTDHSNKVFHSSDLSAREVFIYLVNNGVTIKLTCVMRFYKATLRAANIELKSENFQVRQMYGTLDGMITYYRQMYLCYSFSEIGKRTMQDFISIRFCYASHNSDRAKNIKLCRNELTLKTDL